MNEFPINLPVFNHIRKGKYLEKGDYFIASKHTNQSVAAEVILCMSLGEIGQGKPSMKSLHKAKVCKF